MKERKKVLWVIGDSTLSSFNDKYYYPRYGYGTKLAAYLDDAVEVKNIALSGRSSKSYTTEPQYKELTGGMQKGAGKRRYSCSLYTDCQKNKKR